MRDDLPAISIAIIGIALPVIYFILARHLTKRHSERKDKETAFSFDMVLARMHAAFMNTLDK
jgi:hypothetical protein